MCYITLTQLEPLCDMPSITTVLCCCRLYRPIGTLTVGNLNVLPHLHDLQCMSVFVWACVYVFVCVPIESGRCCNMLEDSSRSSKASQPEISVSNVSIRFLAKSKYRNWRSFPIDCSRQGEKRKEQSKDKKRQMSKNLNNSVIQIFPELFFNCMSWKCSYPWYTL